MRKHQYPPPLERNMDHPEMVGIREVQGHVNPKLESQSATGLNPVHKCQNADYPQENQSCQHLQMCALK